MIQHQPLYYGYQQPMQQPMQQKQQTSLVLISTEEEALRYPMAPGSSILFKIESQPLIIEKVMGFSQFESPQVKKYRIMEEEPPKEPQVVVPDLSGIEDRIDKLEQEIDKLRNKRTPRKKEEEDE